MARQPLWAGLPCPCSRLALAGTWPQATTTCQSSRYAIVRKSCAVTPMRLAATLEFLCCACHWCTRLFSELCAHLGSLQGHALCLACEREQGVQQQDAACRCDCLLAIMSSLTTKHACNMRVESTELCATIEEIGTQGSHSCAAAVLLDMAVLCSCCRGCHQDCCWMRWPPPKM